MMPPSPLVRQRPMPRRTDRLPVAVALAAFSAVAAAWLVLGHTTCDDPFTRTGLRCCALTALTAPWPFAALAYASRRMEPRHPTTAGAALGAVAGAWAAVMVELWCPLAAYQHVLDGNGRYSVG